MKREAFLARAADLQANLRKAHDDVRLLFGATGRAEESIGCNNALDALRDNLEEVMKEADRLHRAHVQSLREEDITFAIEPREEKAAFSELERKTIIGALIYYRNDMDDESLFDAQFLEDMSVDGERMPDFGVYELIERFGKS